MQNASSISNDAIDDLASRHGFSTEAVSSMLESVMRGNGGMAQFNHPEFGGAGQWMRGGMTMVSDMFNNALKSRVDALCADLAQLISQRPVTRIDDHLQDTAGDTRPASNNGRPSDQWWPSNLASPDSTGAQNSTRYAYFSGSHRLAIQAEGKVTVYDTLDHEIGGFSQQQSHDSSISLSSQKGPIDVRRLPVVSVDGVAPDAGR